jgi:hypothetical protein
MNEKEAINKQKKSDNVLFKEYLLSLDRDDRNEIKKRITEECKINYPTIDNWRYGICKIHPLAKDKIEQVAGVKIF